MIWLITMALIGFARTHFRPIAASLTWCFGMMAIDFAAVSDHRLDGGFEIGFTVGIVALLVVVFRTTPPTHRTKNWNTMYAFSLVASVLAAAFWVPIETTCGSWTSVPAWAALTHWARNFGQPQIHQHIANREAVVAPKRRRPLLSRGVFRKVEASHVWVLLDESPRKDVRAQNGRGG